MAQNAGSSSFSSRNQSSLPTGRIPPIVTQPSSRNVNRTNFSDVISLSQPRQTCERRENEYIETPFKPPLPNVKEAKKENNNNSTLVPVHVNRRTLSKTLPRPIGPGLITNPKKLPITSQPSVTTFIKDKTEFTNSSEELQNRESIICHDCGKCKCESCRTPRHLPSKWLCNKTFLCSGDTVLDYCSCMCCVRAAFYHCGEDVDSDSDVSCADKPCSCDPHRRFLRWGCIAAISFVLPCLWCYWPMKGCLKLCDACYNSCTNTGCQCGNRNSSMDSSTTDKRLLDSISDC